MLPVIQITDLKLNRKPRLQVVEEKKHDKTERNHIEGDEPGFFGNLIRVFFYRLRSMFPVCQ